MYVIKVPEDVAVIADFAVVVAAVAAAVVAGVHLVAVVAVAVEMKR